MIMIIGSVWKYGIHRRHLFAGKMFRNFKTDFRGTPFSDKVIWCKNSRMKQKSWEYVTNAGETSNNNVNVSRKDGDLGTGDVVCSCLFSNTAHSILYTWSNWQERGVRSMTLAGSRAGNVRSLANFGCISLNWYLLCRYLYNIIIYVHVYI